MNTLYVIPGPGLRVPDPTQQGTPGYFLPKDGREVEDSDYWRRRLRDEEVTLGTSPAPAPEPAPAPTSD